MGCSPTEPAEYCCGVSSPEAYFRNLVVAAHLDGEVSPEEVGALLRREGLYSSHLTAWRKQLQRHGEEGLTRKRRGPPAKPKRSTREIEFERENRKLQKKLAQAEAIIEFQKKAHELLGLPLKNLPSDEVD